MPARENLHQRLIERERHLLRLIQAVVKASGLILVSLGVGMLGYHYLENLSWVDSLLNASMILGGMGPVNPLRTTGGKLFASFYALYSGMVFLVVAGFVFGPFMHRILHRFHLEMDEEDASVNEKP